MKMRKITCILTAVLMVFAFCMTANAQDICDNCKCEPGSVPCPVSADNTDPQNPQQGEAACPFDYDGQRYSVTSGASGYVSANWSDINSNGVVDTTERNCKVLFDICECPDSCEFLSGQKIGIRMVITTPGVYWAGPAMDTIYFDIFSNEEISNGTACAQNLMDTANVYGGSGIGLDGDPIDSTEVRNFGDVTYYRSYTEETNTNGDIVGTVSNPGTPLEGCSESIITGENAVIALESDINTDYMITRDDTSKCHFWIDVPPMRIDATAVKCAPINVRIILLYDRINTGLCELCHPPITCECLRTVGYVCCEDDPETQQCIYFPYVLIDTEPEWFTGIGITNLESGVDNPTLTFTVVDSAGTSYRASTAFNNTTNAWGINTLLNDLSWTPSTANIVSGAGWLRVQGNFQLDGFEFVVSDSMSFGAATLPRKACEGCGGCPVIDGD